MDIKSFDYLNFYDHVLNNRESANPFICQRCSYLSLDTVSCKGIPDQNHFCDNYYCRSCFKREYCINPSCLRECREINRVEIRSQSVIDIKCYGCNTNIKYSQLVEHIKTCSELKSRCLFRDCNYFCNYREMSQHFREKHEFSLNARFRDEMNRLEGFYY